MVQEDWAEDCRKEPNFAFKTVSMVDRERDGLPMYEHKPDGVEMVSYSTFYDSMFELADAEYAGRTGKHAQLLCTRWHHDTASAGLIEEDTYAEYISDLFEKVFVKTADEDGSTVYG